MEIKINKKNSYDQSHGYWEKFDDYFFRIHWFNGVAIGYYESLNYERLNFDRKFQYRCHYMNNQEIGCEQMNKSQYFYTNSRKKFGEEIKWK